MKCKRAESLFLTLIMVIGMFVIPVNADSEIKVLLDGKELAFDVPPQLINSRTMVPMRKIFEAMGAAVDWNGETNTVYITSPNKKIEEIYQYPNPTVDFSNDDGIMSKLHLELRLLFEQTAFPKSLFENSELLKNLIVNDPEAFLTHVDNEIWGKSMNTVIIRYMTESDEEFNITSEEDIYKHLKDISDKYSLHAYQNYEIDAVKVSEDTSMILFSMAEIYDNLKVPELDKMLLSSYVAVIYNSTTEKFSYYLLEKSLDNYYAVCSIDENMKHRTYGFIENDKKSFVENILLISGK